MRRRAGSRAWAGHLLLPHRHIPIKDPRGTDPSRRLLAWTSQREPDFQLGGPCSEANSC